QDECEIYTERQGMFERFTDPARLVMFRTRENALEQHEKYISPGHLLLALIDLNAELFERILASSESLGALRQELQLPRQPDAPRPSETEVHPCPELWRVLRHARQAAIRDSRQAKLAQAPHVEDKSAQVLFDQRNGRQRSGRRGRFLFALMKIGWWPLHLCLSLIPYQEGRIEPRHILLGLLLEEGS